MFYWLKSNKNSIILNPDTKNIRLERWYYTSIIE